MSVRVQITVGTFHIVCMFHLLLNYDGAILRWEWDMWATECVYLLPLDGSKARVVIHGYGEKW